MALLDHDRFACVVEQLRVLCSVLEEPAVVELDPVKPVQHRRVHIAGVVLRGARPPPLVRRLTAPAVVPVPPSFNS